MRRASRLPARRGRQELADAPPSLSRRSPNSSHQLRNGWTSAVFLGGQLHHVLQPVLVVGTIRRRTDARHPIDSKLASTAERVLVDLAVLHDDLEVLGGVGDQVDILQWIAIDKEQIGKCALLHDAELASIRTAFA